MSDVAVNQIVPVVVIPSIELEISKIFENYTRPQTKKLFKTTASTVIKQFEDLRIPNYWVNKTSAMTNHTTCNQMTSFKTFMYRLEYAASYSDISAIKNICGVSGDYCFYSNEKLDYPKMYYNGRVFDWVTAKESFVKFLAIAVSCYAQTKSVDEVQAVMLEITTMYKENKK